MIIKMFVLGMCCGSFFSLMTVIKRRSLRALDLGNY